MRKSNIALTEIIDKQGNDVIVAVHFEHIAEMILNESKFQKPDIDDAAKEMRNGNWDLTLFTCTYDGYSRIALRCTLVR